MRTSDLLDDQMPADAVLNTVKRLEQIEASDVSTSVEPDAAVSAEAQADEELSFVLLAFQARAQEESKRFWDAVDSEFWFCVYFKTRAQKEAFLNALQWTEHGDKYLDGRVLAEQMNVDLPAASPARKTRRTQTHGIDILEV